MKLMNGKFWNFLASTLRQEKVLMLGYGAILGLLAFVMAALSAQALDNASYPQRITDGQLIQHEPMPRRNIVICENNEGRYVEGAKRFSEQHFANVGYVVFDGNQVKSITDLPPEVSYVYVGGVPISAESISCINKFPILKSLVNEKRAELENPSTPPRVIGIPENAIGGWVSKREFDPSSGSKNYNALITVCYSMKAECAANMMSNIFSVDLLKLFTPDN